jgi:tetratricopeptide (TPR) repeat protein
MITRLNYYKLLFAIALHFLTSTSVGQNKTDSLYRVLEQNPSNVSAINHLSEIFTESSPGLSDSLAFIALSLAQQQNDNNEKVRALVNIMNAAWAKRDFKKIMDFAHKASELYKQLGQPLESARYLNDAAIAAYNIDLYEVSLKNYKAILEILLEIGDSENIPSVLVNMAQVYEKTGMFDSAIYYNNQVIGLSQMPGFETELSAAYANLGLVYKKMGDFEKALEKYKSAYEISVAQNDPNLMADDLNNIAALYSHWENYELARDYLEQARDIYEKSGKKDGVEVAMSNIAFILQKEGKYDSALTMFRDALAIAEKMKRPGSVAIKLSNIGTLFYELGNYDSAIYYQTNALTIFQNLGHKEALCKTIQNLGDIHLAKNELDLAKKYFDEAHLLAEEIRSKTILEKVYQGKTELQVKLGNPGKALEYHKKYVAVKDSIFTVESREKLAEMEARYKNEKKQQEIELLIKDKKLSQAKIRKNQLKLYWIATGLLILLAATAMITVLYLQKIKSNRKLVEKNLKLIKLQECNLATIKINNNNSLSINEAEKTRLLKELTHLISDKKIFTRKKLTLNELAEKLDTNTTYLSHIINSDFHLTFADFLNQLRVQESQKFFMAGKHKNMTIEAIAETVGFHSRSSFNVQFKKFSGVTPSVFIKNLSEDKHKEQMS